METDISVKNSSLIASSSRDEMMKKLKEVEAENLARETEARDELFKRKARRYARAFIEFSFYCFGIKREQLVRFSREEALELEKEIIRKLKPRVFLQKLFCFIPLIGWALAIDAYLSYKNIYRDVSAGACPSLIFYSLRSVLKKHFGKDYFPYDEIQELIKLEKRGEWG